MKKSDKKKLSIASLVLAGLLGSTSFASVAKDVSADELLKYLVDDLDLVNIELLDEEFIPEENGKTIYEKSNDLVKELEVQTNIKTEETDGLVDDKYVIVDGSIVGLDENGEPYIVDDINVENQVDGDIITDSSTEDNREVEGVINDEDLYEYIHETTGEEFIPEMPSSKTKTK